MDYWTYVFLFFSWLPMHPLQMGIQQTYRFHCPSEWRMKMTTTLFSQSKVIILKFQKVVNLVRQHFLLNSLCMYSLAIGIFSFMKCMFISFILIFFGVYLFLNFFFFNLPKNVLNIWGLLTYCHIENIFSVYYSFLILLKLFLRYRSSGLPFS